MSWFLYEFLFTPSPLPLHVGPVRSDVSISHCIFRFTEQDTWASVLCNIHQELNAARFAALESPAYLVSHLKHFCVMHTVVMESKVSGNPSHISLPSSCLWNMSADNEKGQLDGVKTHSFIKFSLLSTPTPYNLDMMVVGHIKIIFHTHSAILMSSSQLFNTCWIFNLSENSSSQSSSVSAPI